MYTERPIWLHFMARIQKRSVSLSGVFFLSCCCCCRRACLSSPPPRSIVYNTHAVIVLCRVVVRHIKRLAHIIYKPRAGKVKLVVAKPDLRGVPYIAFSIVFFYNYNCRY
ncbi:unnamed protein product [Aphis gossypii]|uniref:Uncharacterized protein n=1 Tax=Aphis gossypii TaxID=80765 RepID=A0A9P0IRB5_APHGO|nr:unnamed protein product [Aphis gossypii]